MTSSTVRRIYLQHSEWIAIKILAACFTTFRTDRYDKHIFSHQRFRKTYFDLVLSQINHIHSFPIMKCLKFIKLREGNRKQVYIFPNFH